MKGEIQMGIDSNGKQIPKKSSLKFDKLTSGIHRGGKFFFLLHSSIILDTSAAKIFCRCSKCYQHSGGLVVD